MDAEARYERLLEQALAEEALWSLESSGRLLRYRLEDGGLALPLWGAQEAAALEAADSSEQPVRLGLDELLEEILPQLEAGRGLVAAWPLKGSGFIVDPQALRSRLWEAWEEGD